VIDFPATTVSTGDSLHIEIALLPNVFDLWRLALEHQMECFFINEHRSIVPDLKLEYTEEQLIEEQQGEIIINEKTVPFSISFLDDSRYCADVFISRHFLSADMAAKVELEMLRTQVHGLLPISKAYFQLKASAAREHLVRLSLEQRVQSSESHCEQLFRSQAAVEFLLPKLLSSLEAEQILARRLRSEVQALTAELAACREAERAQREEGLELRLRLGQPMEGYRGWSQRFEELQARHDQAEAAKEELVQQLSACRERLQRLVAEDNSADCNALREQVLQLRLTVTRLQQQVADIQRSAVSAVQELQLCQEEEGAMGPSEEEEEEDPEEEAEEGDIGIGGQGDGEGLSGEGRDSEGPQESPSPSPGPLQRLMAALRSSLGPVVARRLLTRLFGRFGSVGRGQLTLSRFMRFAREAGLSPPAKDCLPLGVLSTVFGAALRTHGPHGTRTRPRAFAVRSKGPRHPPAGPAAPTCMDEEQFLWALGQLALRLFPGPDPLLSLLVLKIGPAAVAMDCEELVPWALLHVQDAVAELGQAGGAAVGILRARTALVVALFESLEGQGTGYNAISQFVHQARIVPCLLQEPFIYSLYEEIFVRPTPANDSTALPLPSFSLGIGSSHESQSSSPIGCFVLMLVSIALKAFPTLLHHHRVEKLLDWIQEHHIIATVDEIIISTT